VSSQLVLFTPSSTQVFTFQPIIGGQQYTATVTWNVFGQRYYLNLYDLAGQLILSTALVSSGPQLQASLTWTAQVATATCTTAHNVPLGTLANAYVSQTDSGFDGQQQMLATGAYTLTYALASNPNEPVPLSGIVSFPLNLVAPLDIGWLLWHYGSYQFEYEAA